MEELIELIRDDVAITAYDSKTVYIAKPKEDGWYHSNPFNVVFNALIENGIEFDIKYFNHEDVFEIDGGLTVVIYEEED